MKVTLSISGNRESVHMALIELMTITRDTGITVAMIDKISTPGDVTPTDRQIRADAARIGTGRYR